MKFYIIAIAALVLGACASGSGGNKAEKDASMSQNVGSAASGAVGQTRDGLGDAVLSPLEDLNLRKDEIPERLVGIQSPYDVPYEMSCEEVASRIEALDAILGADWDTIVPDERLRSEKLATSGADATLGMVASEARGLIPFRGVVRHATGAEKYSKKYAKAFVMGAQRRSYLKGYGLARECPFPARPDFAVMSDMLSDEIVFKGDTPDGARAVPTSKPKVTRRVTRK